MSLAPAPPPLPPARSRAEVLGRSRGPQPRDEGEEYLVVEVIDATPGPDGDPRHYYLRVPPTVRTAREAVAWTFGMEGDEYAPAVET